MASITRLTAENQRLQDQVNQLTAENIHLAQIAYHDELTGLLSRHGLSETIRPVLGQLIRTQGAVSIGGILFDVDYFKRVNDTYGHPAGDLVLAQVAKSIQATVRQSDLVVRWGGEELLVVCFNISNDQLLALAEKIRRLITALQFAGNNGKSFSVTLSAGVGVARVEEEPHDPKVILEALIERIDQALYQAKTTGRDQVVMAE
jgi:diguanylate cyclase (GGDEF)-like protein